MNVKKTWTKVCSELELYSCPLMHRGEAGAKEPSPPAVTHTVARIWCSRSSQESLYPVRCLQQCLVRCADCALRYEYRIEGIIWPTINGNEIEVRFCSIIWTESEKAFHSSPYDSRLCGICSRCNLYIFRTNCSFLCPQMDGHTDILTDKVITVPLAVHVHMGKKNIDCS